MGGSLWLALCLLIKGLVKTFFFVNFSKFGPIFVRPKAVTDLKNSLYYPLLITSNNFIFNNIMLVLHQKQGKEINKTSEMSTERRITYRFSYAMRPNDTNKMTPLPSPSLPPTHTHTPCHMRHSQNFDKIKSFLKSVWNIFIVGNIIVGWGEEVIKDGTCILHWRC